MSVRKRRFNSNVDCSGKEKNGLRRNGTYPISPCLVFLLLEIIVGTEHGKMARPEIRGCFD